MKITEIEWVDGRKYEDEDCEIWVVKGNDLYRNLGDRNREERMSDLHCTQQIALLELEEVIDWSKVEVDTKILVSTNGEIWTKRHFAKYENGLIYTFANNGSSWTEDRFASWEYGKLPSQ